MSPDEMARPIRVDVADLVAGAESDAEIVILWHMLPAAASTALAEMIGAGDVDGARAFVELVDEMKQAIDRRASEAS